MNCPLCSFPLGSDEHVFNIYCGLSNSEYDQTVAAIRDLPDLSDDEGTRRLLSLASEAARDQIALANYKRVLRQLGYFQ